MLRENHRHLRYSVDPMEGSIQTKRLPRCLWRSIASERACISICLPRQSGGNRLISANSITAHATTTPAKTVKSMRIRRFLFLVRSPVQSIRGRSRRNGGIIDSLCLIKPEMGGLGYSGSLPRIVGGHHRVVEGQAPPCPILVGVKPVFSANVPLQCLEFSTAFKAADAIRPQCLVDRNDWRSRRFGRSHRGCDCRQCPMDRSNQRGKPGKRHMVSTDKRSGNLRRLL